MSPVLWITLAIVVVIALLAAALIMFGRRAMQRQRVILQDARRRGAAYLCLPTLGQQRSAMATVTVDAQEIRVVRQAAEPVLIASFPAAGSVFEPARVRVNVGATVDGVRVVAPDGRDVQLVIYPDPTLGHTKPLHGAELAEAMDVMQATTGRR